MTLGTTTDGISQVFVFHFCRKLVSANKIHMAHCGRLFEKLRGKFTALIYCQKHCIDKHF